jgi:hypothetical protein
MVAVQHDHGCVEETRVSQARDELAERRVEVVHGVQVVAQQSPVQRAEMQAPMLRRQPVRMVV